MIIYTPQGEVFYDAPVTKSAVIRNTLMGDYYIELPFNLKKQKAFKRGCYIIHKGFKFKIKDIVNPDFDSKTGGYKYTLRFWARQNDMKDVRIKWLKSARQETTFKDTTDLLSFGNLIADNMNTFEDCQDWVVAGVPANLEKTTKLISFKGDTVWDSLNRIAETFDVEWWTIENGTQIWIYFGKLELGTPEVFKRGEVVSSIPARKGDDSEYGTRFYVYGSTRNLPEDYDTTEQGGVTNLISENRLHLPDGMPYVDAWEPLEKDDIIEQVAFFDDIYPKSTETITAIETIPRKVENSDDPDFQTFDAYVMVCKDTPFLPSDVIVGETLGCRFTSGVFAGRDFKLAIIKDDDAHTVIDPSEWKPEDGFNKKFEIIADQEDSGGDRPLIIPNEQLHPEPGDTFVLTGIRLPEERVKEAEEELLKVAKVWAIKNSSDTTIYECPTNPVFCTHNDKNYELGQTVVLVDERFGSERRLSRIQAYEKALYNEYIATYTVGDNSAYSRLGDMEKSIVESAYAERIGSTSGGAGIYVIRSEYDSTLPTDSNVYSAKASDKRFLNKLTGGTVSGKTTFEKGVQIGRNFVPGITGVGGNIDENANAELESLKLRRFLEVPELRYNRTKVEIGNVWNPPGGGIVQNVTIDEDGNGGTVFLKLEDGEIGAVAVGDICMGIFHNATNLDVNATKDSDDSKGNFTFAGFSTVYFNVTQIVDEGTNARFRYALRPVSDTWKYLHQPQVGMHFAAYGNFIDPERQTSRYATRTYERYLRNVNDWEFGAENIAAQFGDLSNLSVFGIDMSGYSAYLNNIYMTGRIQQFTPSGEEVPTINDRGVWANGETYNKNDDVYHNNAKWRCLKDGTTSEPSKGSSDWLLLEEALKGEDGAQGKDGTDARTYILEPSTLAMKRGYDNALTPTTVTFSAFYRDGDSATRTAYAGRFVIAESTDGNTFVNKYTSLANESTKVYTPSATNVTAVRCTLYAAGGTTTMLDVQTTVILKDIDNLQIGGRNLLLGTQTFDGWRTSLNKTENGYDNFTTSEYDATDIDTSYINILERTDVVVEPDTVYTLSYFAKGTQVYTFCHPNVNAQVLANNTGATLNKDGDTKQYVNLTDEWERYYVTFRTLSTVSGNKNVLFRVPKGYKAAVCGVKLEKGNIATDWSPAPEDTQADIDAAQTAADDAQKTVDSLKDFTNTAFADGIIDRAEAVAIEKYKNSVNETKKAVDASYNAVYTNSLLSGTAQGNLKEAKSAFDTAVDDLLASVATASDDGIATDAEKADVDAKYALFNDAYSTYTTRLEEAQAAIETTINTTAQGAYQLSEQIRQTLDNLTTVIIPDLQDQIDGQIVSWTGEDVPTLNNYPASDWKTDSEKKRHENDYYDRKVTASDGSVSYERYKFTKSENTYTWERISDSGAAQALAEAREALGIAGSKVKLFYGDSTPSVPYSVNDVWIKIDGSIYICNADRMAGSTASTVDWMLVNDSQARLRQMSSDSVISREEKAVLRNRLAQINNEFAQYQSDATKYGISITALTSAKNNLVNFLTGTVAVNNDTDTTLTTEQRTNYNTYFANYDAEVSRFGNLVADKLAEEATSLIVTLSNEYQGIPSDATGAISSFPDCSTTVQVFYGTTDVSAEATYATTPSGLTGSWNASTRTFTVTALSADAGYVDIKATYKGLTTTKRFNIAKAKAGENGSSYTENLLLGTQTFDGWRTSLNKTENGYDNFTTSEYDATDIDTSYINILERTDVVVEPDTVYTLSYFAKGTQVYTFCHPNVNAQVLANNTGATLNKDGDTKQYVNLTDEWERYYVTFRTLSTVSGNKNVLFRVPKGYKAAICGVKLEKGNIPNTVWTPNSSEMVGIPGTSARTYILEPSTLAMKRGYNNALTPTTVTFSAFYRDGNSATRTAYAGRFVIAESTDGNTFVNKYTSSADESTKVYTPSAANVTAVRCTLYAAGGTTTMLDVQTTVILKDGEDGESALTVVLSNEFIGVPCDSDGNIVGGNTTLESIAYTEITVYYGTQNVTGSCGFSKNERGLTGNLSYNYSTSAYSYTVTKLTYDNAYVEFIISYPGITVTKKFTVVKVKDGAPGSPGSPGAPGQAARIYLLESSTFGVKRNMDGSVTPSQVTLNAYYRDGNSETKTSYQGKYKVTAISRTGSNVIANTTAFTSSYSFNVPTDDDIATIECQLLNSSNQVLATQTITVLSELDSCILRTTQWAEGLEFRNDSNSYITELKDPYIRYLDIVAINDDKGNQHRFQCKKTHVSSVSNNPLLLPEVNDYWEPMNTMAPIYTPLLIAENGIINFMQGNRLLIQDAKQNVVAGFIGDNYPLWVGATYENRANAPFRVQADGSFVATNARLENADVSGTIKSGSGNIGGFEISQTQLESISGNDSMLLSASLIRFIGKNKESSVFIGANTIPDSSGGSIFSPQRIEVNRANESALNYIGNIGLYLSVQGATLLDGVNNQYTGNHALYIPKGDICGFRLRAQRVDSTRTLSVMDSIIYVISSANITLTLPPNAEDGQMYFIRNRNRYVTTIQTQGGQHIVRNWNTESSRTTSVTLEDGNMVILTYDAVNKCWTHNYIGY